MKKNFIKALCLILLTEFSGLTPKAHAIKIIHGKKYFAYMVQSGETIASLTNAFKITEEELLEQNPDAKNGLKENTVILIPVKEGLMNENLPEINVVTYKVKPGDTLFSLARDFNSTIEDIIQRNLEELSDGILNAGSTIKIAKNSGGLTGGEVAKQEREKAAKAAAESAAAAKADSLAKVRKSYWSQEWTVIDVKEPASINTLKTENEWRKISRLKVTGNANELDISIVGKRIFEFDRINALDLHEVYGIKTLKNKDFEECSSLKAIALPNSLDSIGNQAFFGATNIEVVRCYAVNPPKVSETSLQNINLENCTLEVPKSALEKYKAAKYWKDFSDIKSIPTIADDEKK